MAVPELQTQYVPWWNVPDYVPLMSNVSGSIRGLFGVVESVVGVVTLPFELLGRIAFDPRPFVLVDGVANVVRGSIAETPILGNVVLYLYDHSVVFKTDFQRSAGLRFN